MLTTVLAAGPVPAETAFAVREREREADYHRALLAQYQPIGPLESLLVGELARRAAAMDRCGDAAGAVVRFGVRSASTLLPELLGATTDEDTALALTISSRAVQSAERLSLAQSRAFREALAKLEELQARRRAGSGRIRHMPPAFADETSCQVYLVAQYTNGHRRCQHCGETRGYLIRSNAWECASCHRQIGRRAGTVMAKSPLALWPWFEGVRWLLWRPTISSSELSHHIRITRASTVRLVARRIREALASSCASELLVGLDRHYHGAECQPEPGVHA